MIPWDWLPAFTYGGAILAALELAYLLLRRHGAGWRSRILYHLWAIDLALVAGLALTPFPGREPAAWRIAVSGAVVLGTLVLFSLLDALVFERPWDRARGPMMPKLVRDGLRLLLLLAVGLLILSTVYQLPLSALLVSSTVVSAVIGLALQDVLKNLFAGVALDIEKPFVRGDWLMIDGQTQAQVIDLTWRSTRLRTKEGVDVYEPNATVSTSRLMNLGAGDRPVAVNVQIGLPYGTPPAEVKAALEEAAREAPGALQRPPPRIYFERFGDDHLLYRLRVWTGDPSDLGRFQDAVNSRVWYQLARRGISIPFPMRTVHLHPGRPAPSSTTTARPWCRRGRTATPSSSSRPAGCW